MKKSEKTMKHDEKGKATLKNDGKERTNNKT